MSGPVVPSLRLRLLLGFLGATALVAAAFVFLGDRFPVWSVAAGATGVASLAGWLLSSRWALAHVVGDPQTESPSPISAASGAGTNLDAVERLASGMARDFNEILSVVLSHTAVALEGMHAEDPLFASLQQVRLAGLRGAKLTGRLMALTQDPAQVNKAVDLGALVDEMGRSIRRVASRCEVVFTRDAGPSRVPATSVQLEQILMNLVLNARDAMPDGGKLTIDLRRVELPGTGPNLGLPPGRYVRLRVSDTGCGMAPAVKEHLFEPFFTTKDRSVAAGLGLSTVHAIVRQRGGHVGVESAEGRGTTIEIHLPEASATFVRDNPSSGSTRAARTILVVEDEEQVRSVVERILRRHRYGVLVAGSPQEAMTICERHPGRIDLLVTDVVMPEMNGQALAEHLLERRPEMKVLFMSGYASDVAGALGDERAREAFLQKPVTPEALRQKVRGILRLTSSHRGSA